MNVTDYDITTDDHSDGLSINKNCTINENNFDIIIPTIFLTIPCVLSFLCLMSLMIYTLNKPLFNNKGLRKFYTQLIRFDVS